MSTMRERFEARFDKEYTMHVAGSEFLLDVRGLLEEMLAFAASEVALALQPRPPEPELADAEKWIRRCAEPIGEDWPGWNYCQLIAAEFDRLRAEVARLTGEAQKTVYTGATTAENALAEAMAGGLWAEGERDSAAASCEHGEHAYEVRLTARKVALARTPTPGALVALAHEAVQGA